jgi:hypothetical protein
MSNAPTIEDTVALFWSKVSVGGPDECWEWNGARTKPVRGQAEGYGFLQARRFKPTPIKAHVFSYMLANARWPRLHVLHTCDNPPCVNPAHLYEGTQAQNMADRAARKPRFGAANPAAKHGGLVGQIRGRIEAGETQADVARSLHLNSGVVSRIARGVNYPREDI